MKLLKKFCNRFKPERAFLNEDKLERLLGVQLSYWEHEDYPKYLCSMLEKTASMDAVNQMSYPELMTYMGDMLLRDMDFMSMQIHLKYEYL